MTPDDRGIHAARLAWKSFRCLPGTTAVASFDRANPYVVVYHNRPDFTANPWHAVASVNGVPVYSQLAGSIPPPRPIEESQRWTN